MRLLLQLTRATPQRRRLGASPVCGRAGLAVQVRLAVRVRLAVLVALAVLIPLAGPHVSAAHAEELPAFAKSSALQAKLLAFLTGASLPVPTGEIPGLALADPPPSWLVHWQATLERELQHDVALAQHTLLRAHVPVVRLPAAASRGLPVLAQPLRAADWTCPPQAPARVAITVLHAGDDAAPPWLGLDVACVDARPQLLRHLRLLVQTNPWGHVQRAFGVQWLAPVTLLAAPEPRAVPEAVWTPTPLDKRFTWLVALPGGGWLAQLQVAHRGTWHADRSLPRLEDLVGPAEDPQPDARRVTLLLAEDAAPRAALWHDGADASGRLPMWREGAWDAGLGEPGQLLVFQRIGQPSGDDRTGVRAWSHAGYAVWQIKKDTVASVELPLVPSPEEGVWDCEAESPVRRLSCQFRRLGTRSEGSTERRVFAWDAGPPAVFRLLPPSDALPADRP